MVAVAAAVLLEPVPFRGDSISQKFFTKPYCKGGYPYKSVNVSFIITNIKNKLTKSFGD